MGITNTYKYRNQLGIKEIYEFNKHTKRKDL